MQVRGGKGMDALGIRTLRRRLGLRVHVRLDGGDPLQVAHVILWVRPVPTKDAMKQRFGIQTQQLLQPMATTASSAVAGSRSSTRSSAGRL